MRSLAFLLALTFCVSIVFASSQLIVCGTQPGAIYLTGVHPDYVGPAIFYYSADSGQTLELRNYGDQRFLPDPADCTIYGFGQDGCCLTTDGGFNWSVMNPSAPWASAAGTVTGEIYRRAADPWTQIERSTNYGQSWDLIEHNFLSVEGEKGALPGAVSLYAFPNPANPFTVASFELRVASFVKLGVYDVCGRLVHPLASEFLLPGSHQFRWDARDAASGVYLLRLETHLGVEAERIVVVK